MKNPGSQKSPDPGGSPFPLSRLVWYRIKYEIEVFSGSLILNIASDFWSDSDLGLKILKK